MKIVLACRLFGYCRQAYYQSKSDLTKEKWRDFLIIKNIREIRREDLGIGCYKLWLMLNFSLHGENGKNLDRKQGLTKKESDARFSENHNGREVARRIALGNTV